MSNLANLTNLMNKPYAGLASSLLQRSGPGALYGAANLASNYFTGQTIPQHIVDFFRNSGSGLPRNPQPNVQQDDILPEDSEVLHRFSRPVGMKEIVTPPPKNTSTVNPTFSFFNQGGVAQMSPPMRLLYPNQPPGPMNPYIPTQMSPPIDTTGRLGQIPPSSGPGPFSEVVNVGAPANLGGALGGMGADPSIIERIKALAANYSGQSAPNPQAQFNNLTQSVQGLTGGSEPMSNPFRGGSPFGFSIDQSMIDRVREIIRQRQQEMGQSTPQQPQIDPAAIQARLDEFLANNPDSGPISLPLGGNLDTANLRDRMARLSALMGRGMTFQEAMGNQRAAIAQGHDLDNDGIVTDAEYRQSTTPAGGGRISQLMSALPTGESAINPESGTPMIEGRISQLMNALGGGRM